MKAVSRKVLGIVGTLTALMLASPAAGAPGEPQAKTAGDTGIKPKSKNKKATPKHAEAAPARDSRGPATKKSSTAQGKTSPRKRTAAAEIAHAGRDRSSLGDKPPAGAKAKSTKPKAPPKPCLGAPITIDKLGTEKETLTLLDCNGAVRSEALERLSVLARPWSAARPTEKSPARASGVLGPRVRLLDSGLAERLDRVARHFKGRAISVVSGYRPESTGSLHQRAQAIDFRVAGISTTALVAYCRTLPDTGCGYYPKSQFVHMDVRPKGTGHAYWIDASGPGESPNYVASWPPPATPVPTVPSGPEIRPTEPTPPRAVEERTMALSGFAPRLHIAP